MKEKASTAMIIFVFMLGLLILLYPTVSNWYNEQMNSYVVSNYTQAVGNKNEEEFAQILKEARAYNQTLHGMEKHFISGAPEDPAYVEALNVYKGIMGYIVIDSLGVKVAISHGTHEDVLQKEVGHLEGSSLPTGDVGNNTVLTGHTGLPSAELFTDLNQMELGDTFKLFILNEEFTYEVFNIVVVEPHEVDNLNPIDGEDVVTLITCTPYGVNSHRLLVQGKQIPTVEKSLAPVASTMPQETGAWYEEIHWVENAPKIAMPIILILLLLILLTFHPKKRGG